MVPCAMKFSSLRWASIRICRDRMNSLEAIRTRSTPSGWGNPLGTSRMISSNRVEAASLRRRATSKASRSFCRISFSATRIRIVPPEFYKWKMGIGQPECATGRSNILFHEWGNGDSSEAWVQVREKARSLFQEAGVEPPFHPGARSEVEVDSCLRSLGLLRREQIEAGAGHSSSAHRPDGFRAALDTAVIPDLKTAAAEVPRRQRIRVGGVVIRVRPLQRDPYGHVHIGRAGDRQNHF